MQSREKYAAPQNAKGYHLTNSPFNARETYHATCRAATRRPPNCHLTEHNFLKYTFYR